MAALVHDGGMHERGPSGVVERPPEELGSGGVAERGSVGEGSEASEEERVAERGVGGKMASVLGANVTSRRLEQVR